MSKAVLISINPKWVKKIANGKKTIEVRKTAPKLETPFKCYIYCTKGDPALFNNSGKITTDSLFCSLTDTYMYRLNGEVVAEFTCTNIHKVENKGSYFAIENDIAVTNGVAKRSCLDFDDMKSYLGKKGGYAWEIEGLKVYDEPKELSKVDYYCDGDCDYCRRAVLKEDRIDCYKMVECAPQSWCYVEEI